MKAIEMGFNYLHHLKLRQSVEIFEAILELESLFDKFRILHDFPEVKVAVMNWNIYISSLLFDLH